ncbi:hypothetical protein BDB01DRAFT_106584 [Pilobolus umbonatus]|nr:hypothetical protein BDB01DRAFT_106584 [Pilobolus umbonatus]
MADDIEYKEEDKHTEPDHADQNKGMNNLYRMMNTSTGMYDPMMSMGMGMVDPIQFQRYQQMFMMQQFQRQQMQRQMSSVASANPLNVNNIPPESQKPPGGYVCFKCGQPGHWIYYCPNVPKGQFVPRADMNSHDMNEDDSQKPQELCCMLCDKLMSDAVVIPCCGKSFCKELRISSIERLFSIRSHFRCQL